MSTTGVVQATIVSRTSPKSGQMLQQLALFAQDGTPVVLPAQAAAQADVAAVTSVVAAGANPTKAEYDALRADLLATRTVLNSLLAKLRTANVIAT